RRSGDCGADHVTTGQCSAAPNFTACPAGCGSADDRGHDPDDDPIDLPCDDGGEGTRRAGASKAGGGAVE
ncbi:MAG: hypothetical protein ACRDZW_00155, partial [Acidimicrobiales bacterium]